MYFSSFQHEPLKAKPQKTFQEIAQLFGFKDLAAKVYWGELVDLNLYIRNDTPFLSNLEKVKKCLILALADLLYNSSEFGIQDYIQKQ